MDFCDLRKLVECSICLDIYIDPVNLRCGHSFCRVCINRLLDVQEECIGYSCPNCRERFSERPTLHRNLEMYNMAEDFVSAQWGPGSSKNFCTYCIHFAVPAVKICLLCEAFLCKSHLRVHRKRPTHILVDPTSSPDNRKCLIHKKILEFYCTDDKTCVCASCCLMGGHKGHNIETLEEAAEREKMKLRNHLENLTVQTEETEKRLGKLREHYEKVQDEVDGETERVIFLLRRHLKDLETTALGEISRRAGRLVLPLSDAVHQLEIKKEELSRRIRYIEDLCNGTDPLTVLQEQGSGNLSGEKGIEVRGRCDDQLHVDDGHVGDQDIAQNADILNRWPALCRAGLDYIALIYRKLHTYRLW